MTESQYQARYWNLLVEIRVHVSYLHHYAASSERWDKATNVFLALTSSGSIAAWALWKEFTYVWPVLIATSQVITAVKPFLPYRERQKLLSGLCNQLQMVCLAMEEDWYFVAEGKLSEEEIHNLTVKYRSQSVEAEQKQLKDVIVPRSTKLLSTAEADARVYFMRHYNVEFGQ